MWFLDATLKSILCQSGTPVLKKLLRFALTVRPSAGTEMNCSPRLLTMKDPFSFFEGLRHIHAITRLFLQSLTDALKN